MIAYVHSLEKYQLSDSIEVVYKYYTYILLIL